MTAKNKKEKKVMEEKRPSLPEVVTVRKRPRTPGVTLNRLKVIPCVSVCAKHTDRAVLPIVHFLSENSRAFGTVFQSRALFCHTQGKA